MPHWSLILLLPATIMAVEDYRRRSVRLLWLLLFCAMTVGCAVTVFGWQTAGSNFLCGLALLAYVAIGIIVYLRVSHHRWINPLDGWFGMGDLVFLLAITPLMNLRTYLLFLLTSAMVSLAWWVIRRKRNKHIPLITVSGVLLGVYIIAASIWKI